MSNQRRAASYVMTASWILESQPPNPLGSIVEQLAVIRRTSAEQRVSKLICPDDG